MSVSGLRNDEGFMMTDITSASTPEGAKQESSDAQTFDELTSLQQEGASSLSAEKNDVAVSEGETAKLDDPSLVTQTTVHYGSKCSIPRQADIPKVLFSACVR